ncbi:hypothetical protein [Micromonospora rifamycinica]|uniref:Uncharacterized protein n=1 Tax=Micromonospora rifamycinica TaxID=291594 RepID=A0A109IQ77_9ACTN|nr:hypothetical protein [Micromonospora rifamycinica]KWV34644.1 hypothetical protein AWV63_00270 [Micromonospora rifamycinica]SCG67357.1 hypothetical protein GA0070623_3266 [Micromonospora rifamycinica]
MTDSLGPLRQAMAELSEHGGSADLYEGALHRSRRSQRRAAVATGVAAVAVVSALGGVVALAVGHRSDLSGTPAATPGGAGPGNPDCPSVDALGALVELPKGWSFTATGVQCAQTWAAADVTRPAGGNVRYLFHYATDTGWRYYGQGAEWDCAELGLTRPAPFCTS